MNKFLKKRKPVEFFKAKQHIGIIYIQTTRNNTIMTLTDSGGNPISWCSCGSLGFKNSRKSTLYGATAVAEKLGAGAVAKGVSSVKVLVKGLGFAKRASIKALYKSGLSIRNIKDITPIPHNGCRRPKKRRI